MAKLNRERKLLERRAESRPRSMRGRGPGPRESPRWVDPLPCLPRCGSPDGVPVLPGRPESPNNAAASPEPRPNGQSALVLRLISG